MMEPARAIIVQAARHEFLARAGFAKEQHVGRSVGQVADLLAQGLHDRGSADQYRFDTRTLFELTAQVMHCHAQCPFFHRAGGDIDQSFRGERFFEEIVGTVAHRLNGHIDVTMASDENHRDLAVDLHGMAQQIEAAHLR